MWRKLFNVNSEDEKAIKTKIEAIKLCKMIIPQMNKEELGKLSILLYEAQSRVVKDTELYNMIKNIDKK